MPIPISLAPIEASLTQYSPFTKTLLFLLVSALSSAQLPSHCSALYRRLVPVVTSTQITQARSTEIRHWIEKGAVNYFIDNTHPRTGMTLDRAPKDGSKSPTNRIASLAATGFSMTIMADAAKRGLVDPALAQTNIENALRFALSVKHHEGWLPHFIDWETGANTHNSEYSTIDTGLFLSGALFAARSFPENVELQKLAHTLYERIDFSSMMTNGGTQNSKRTLSMGWDPRTQSYIKANWDNYSEHIILQILGLGHPIDSKRLPEEAWKAWKRQSVQLPTGAKLIGADMPLFTHQYSWSWLNPHALKSVGFDPFENSRVATLRDRDLSASNPLLAPYGIWGLSASDGPPPDSYRAYRHGDKMKDPGDNNGTVCPGCVAGSLVYAREDVLKYLDGLLQSPYKDQITGRYGFVDAFNPSRDWVGDASLGITVGPAYLSSRNLDDGAIWKVFQKIPEIQKGIGLTKKPQ